MIRLIQGRAREHIARLATISITLSLMMATTFVTTYSANALTACAIGSSAQNNISVEPSQPTVMYIDSGVSPRIDASYVGYRITNSTGSTLKGYWASIDNFAGGVISLANPLDKFIEVPELANNASTTVYFLVKATAATKVTQSHDFKIFDKRPDASTAVNKYGCTFGFTKVAETIKASANILDRNNPFDQVTIGSIGETFTVVVRGSSGTIGAGSADVGKILWFTPTAYSNFPTRSFRLESVLLKIYNNSQLNATSNGQNPDKLWTYRDRTFVKTSTIPDTGIVTGSQSTADPLDGKRYYENVYTFRLIAKGSANLAPIAQISSGTQIKHQATGTTVSLNAASALLPITISKTVDTTTANMVNLPKVTISGSSYIEVPYRLTLTNSGTKVLRVDQIVDTPARNSIYKSGSSQIKIGAASVAVLPNPETLTSEAALNPMPLHFIGPFDVPASSSIIIYYKIYIPAVQGTYSNNAIAYIGDSQIISSTTASLPSVNISVNESGTATTYETKTVTLLPEGITFNASSIDTSTGTINGTIDANGDTGTTGFFEWATNSTLTNPIKIDVGSATGTEPVSKSSTLTGLTPATTYYYRIVAFSNNVRYAGQILSFTTLVQKAAPTVTTDPPSSISSSNATLNATVNSNLTSVSIQFLVWKTTDTKTVLVVDDATLVYNSSSNPYSVFAGGYPSSISINMADAAYTTINSSPFLSANSTYYYIAQIVDSGNTNSVLATGATQTFSLRTYVNQSITFNPISNIVWGDAAPTINPTASSNLTVTRSSNTPTVCTIDSSGNIVILKAGTCSISANQSGGPGISPDTNYYNPAAEVTQSFDISPKPITVTAVAATKQYGDLDPVFTYTVSGALVNSDTFTGTVRPDPGASVGTYTINQDSLSLSSNYTLTYNSAIFTITPRLITITANPKTKVYGDVDPALTYQVTSGSLVSAGDLTGSLHRASGSDVGSYTIDSGTVVATSNYTLTFVSANLTITKKSLVITADNKSKRTADSDPVFTYSITTGALIGSDTLTGTLARTSPSTNIAGTYSIETGTIEVASPATSNYNFSVRPGTLTITDKLIPTLYWPSPTSIVYGTLLSSTQRNAEARDGTTALPGNCVYDPGLGTKLSVGPHTLSVTCTPTDSSTYSAVSGTVLITVTGRPITVKAASKTKVYGDADPVLTWSITAGSLIDGETLTGTLNRTAGETVGNWAINQGSVDNSDYLITFIGDTLTVTAKPLTVTITAPDKQYDQDTDSSLNIGSLVGVLSGDSGQVAIDNSKIVGLFGNYNAGTNKTVFLTINAGVLTGSKSENHTLTTPSNPTATISKSPVTVTAANKTVTAGNPIGSISYSVASLIGTDSGDPFTGITCVSDYDLVNDDSMTVRYTRCSGGTATNYIPNFVDGTVTIVDATTVTYSVTYSAGLGGGTVPTESDKVSGESFNLAGGSGLTRPGFTFAGWRCNGGVTLSAGTSYTMPSSAITCEAQWNVAATYSVTYTFGSGGGTVPTETNKYAGQTFNLATGAGLSKSGSSFDGWSCNSSSTLSTGYSYTMPSGTVTCVAQWRTNASGGPGNSNNNSNNSSNANTSNKKALVVSLVTIAVTPVKAVAVASPTPSASPTPTVKPSSSPTPSASPTPTVSSGSSGNTNGNGAGTSTPTPNSSSGANSQGKSELQLSEVAAIPTKNTKEITFSGVGISRVAVVGSEVSVQARKGFSGSTTVKITLKSDQEISTITAEVLVLPTAPTNAVATVTGKSQTRITWDRSPNALSYEVVQGESIVCAARLTNCIVRTALKPSPQIQIKAFGRSKTVSPLAPVTHKVEILPVVIPDVALVINFDTNKYNLDDGDKAKIEAFAADVKLYRYKKIDISGHTDSQGGVDNNVLSTNRAKAARDYLLTLVPDLEVVINGFAFAVNVAPNTTSAGMAANRRAEFRVVG